MPPPSGHEMRFRLRRQRRFQHSFRRLTLAACELCGFVSGRRVVVKRHRRLCSRTPESSTCLSCDQCAWTGDTVRTYLDHRRATHGDHITIVKNNSSKSSSKQTKAEQDRGSVASASTLDAPIQGSMTSSATDAATSDVCLPPPEVDDDERSLDENLRPMDGQIWLPDVDGGTFDAFQTTTRNWSTTALQAHVSGGKPDVELRTNEKLRPSSAVEEPLPTSGGLFRCRYCRYTNAHKWKMASHMKASHAGRLVYRCPHCPKFITDRRVEWCAHRSRHTGKTVFSCSECAYETTMKRNFERHLERHVAGGPRRCTICSYSSTGEGAIQRHMAEYHPPSPPPQLTTTTANSSSGGEVAPLSVAEGRRFEVQQNPASSSVLLFKPSKTMSAPNGIARPLTGKPPIILCDVSGRWTCPVCPLSYKRPADLNRHMKQKHDVALKDFAVTRTPPVATASTSPPPETLISAVPVTLFDTPSDTSDQPLNLSLKESATISWQAIDSAVNLTTSEMDQTEPLDLSVVRANSDAVDDVLAMRLVKTTFGYPCNQCTYVSKRASDLRRHQLVHYSSKRYRCPYCVGDRSYKLQFDLGRHMAKVHGKVGGKQDTSVIETVIQSKPYEMHVTASTGSIYGDVLGGQMTSATRNIMACPYCQYVGKNMSELERHARLHSGEKPHRCPHCSFQTVWNDDLSRHIQRAHGETTEFSDAVKLEVDYNMNVEDGRKRLTAAVVRRTRVGNFIGDAGGQSLVNSDDVRSKGRCPVCPFISDSPTIMSFHLESHEKTEGRQFVCMACGMTFADRQECRKHVASLHADVAAAGMDTMVFEVKPDQPSPYPDHPVLTLNSASGSGPVDVDALAEQYANEVTEMFYGNESAVTTPAGNGAAARRYGVAMACRSARADRCRPFKCSHCGRRSNWRWDLKKHIRASRHPNAEVIELSDEEARRSFHVDIAATDRPSPPTNKPYRCSRCGHRSNWKSDVTKHIRAMHPLSRIVIMDDDEATATLAEYETRVNSEKAMTKVHGETASSPEDKALYTVDRQKLKRLRCSACPYRSNFRSDVGRHIRYKHRGVGQVPITVMSAVEAAATLQDYIDMWTHKKITPSSHAETTNQDADAGGHLGSRSVEDEGFEIVEGVDETLPWKCAACQFIHPAKQVVVQHWQRHHCAQVKVMDPASTSDVSDSQNVTYVSSKAEDSDSLTPKKKKARRIAAKTLRCDICPYRTNKLGLLTIHKTYHRPQAKNTYKCTHCPYYVCAPRLLHQHTRIHTVQSTPNGDATSKDGAVKRSEVVAKADDLRCSICPYVGRSKNDSIYHRQFHRSRPTAPYRCQHCPFWVGEKGMLAHHQKVHQTVDETRSSTEGIRSGKDGDGKGPASAKDGVKGGGNVSSMASCVVYNISHQATVGNLSVDGGKAEGRPTADGRRRRVARTLWRCDRCPYVTAKRSQHQTHRKLHGSCQRHTCQLCDYSVGGLHLLMQHVRLHHRQPDAEQATHAPTQEPSEDRHTKQDRPLFRCDRCPYANSRRDHLQCHARFHDSDGPLRCPQCDYSVSKVHLLTQHMRVHQQLSTDDAQNSSKTTSHATKDQFMRSLSLTTK